jgi:hypothetical protein
LSCGSGAAGRTSVALDTGGTVVIRCVQGLASLHVNEFMTGAVGAANDEFVEIVNTGQGSADVSGFRLVYRSANGSTDIVLGTFPVGATIAAGGRYLFAGSAYSGLAAPNQTFSTGLASTAGGLGLRNADGTLVDSVGYGPSVSNGFQEGAPAPAPPLVDSPGASASRLPDGVDTDNNASDFSVTRPPTPGQANN